jgi:hypothetical protein
MRRSIALQHVPWEACNGISFQDRHNFGRYHQPGRAGDCLPRSAMGISGLGPQTVTWNFPILEDAQIAMLETFLSASAIFIQSKKRDGTTGIFEVYMNWLDPRQDGDHMAGFRGYRSGLAIEFFILSEV